MRNMGDSLNRIKREGLIEQVTFKWKPKGDRGMSHADIG